VLWIPIPIFEALFANSDPEFAETLPAIVVRDQKKGVQFTLIQDREYTRRLEALLWRGQHASFYKLDRIMFTLASIFSRSV